MPTAAQDGLPGEPAWWELHLAEARAGWSAQLWEALGAVAVAEVQGPEEAGAERSSSSGGGLVATFAGWAAAAAAQATLGAGELAPAPEAGQWRDLWRAWATPTLAGRVLVRPAWLAPDPAGEVGRAVITLEPGAAWGHGGHPSTRLVLEVLSDRLRGGETVLDVGCGSGALSVGALALGAGRVTAIDIDPAAVAATAANAARNGFADRVAVGPWPVTSIRRRFDVVVANIGAGVIVELAEPLAARLAAPGLLVLSGLLDQQVDDVLERFAAVGGTTPAEVRHDAGWATPVLVSEA